MVSISAANYIFHAVLGLNAEGLQFCVLPISSNMSLLDRMVLGVERVRDRLVRVSAALEAAGIPYAVAGGNRGLEAEGVEGK